MLKTYRIFAYGSLLHQRSLTRTVPDARNIIPAQIRGYKRVFNLASHNRYDDVSKQPVCVLNIETAEQENFMNGSCFDMQESSLQHLLQREHGYELCAIQAHHYHKPQQKFGAYIFHAKDFKPYSYLSNSSAQRHYMNLCLQGSQAFGPDFVDDFKRSTSFWGISCQKQQQAIWIGRY